MNILWNSIIPTSPFSFVSNRICLSVSPPRPAGDDNTHISPFCPWYCCMISFDISICYLAGSRSSKTKLRPSQSGKWYETTNRPHWVYWSVYCCQAWPLLAHVLCTCTPMPLYDAELCLGLGIITYLLGRPGLVHGYTTGWNEQVGMKNSF